MRKLISIVLIIYTKLLYGQDDPSSINTGELSNMAAPNVASFIRYKESPVNYYSGKASFSIPIYTIKVGDLEYPISLNYSAGGIQVNSMASDVGLGWSLASTFINRTIVGDADLETIGSGYLFKIGYFDKPVRINHRDFTNVDFFPDLFKFVSPKDETNFYFPTKTTVVELNKKSTKINWSILTKKHNYLISAYNGQPINNNLNISDYDNFELTTKNGISYYFDQKDLTHSFRASANDFAGGFGTLTGTYPRVSSWHVSKIKNKMNDEEINFVYETYTSDRGNNTDIIFNSAPYYNYSIRYPLKDVPGGTNNNIYFYGLLTEQGVDNAKFWNRFLDIKRLKKINFRGGSVEFNYEKGRDDLFQGKALTSIVVKNSLGDIIKRFDLVYDYFYSTLQKNEFSKRLKLKSVQESGQNAYEFEYYEDNKLPNIGSSLQDFFGYNNAIETTIETPRTYNSKYYYYPNKSEYSILPYDLPNDSNHYILDGQIDKVPNELSKTWSLKKITFPTGGTNEYILESNTFNLSGNTVKGGGVRIQQQIIQENISSPSRIISYNYNKGSNISSGYLFNVPYVGYPTSNLFPVTETNPNLSNYLNLKDYFFLYNNAKINFDIVNNFFVGYSKIEESENQKRTIYEYYNEEYPNVQTRTYYTVGLTTFPLNPLSRFIKMNSAFGNDMYIDKSYKRGKLKYIFSKEGTNLLMKKENIYKTIDDENTSSNSLDTFSVVGLYLHDDTSQGVTELLQNTKSYNAIYNNLAYTKTTQYLPSGNIENESYMYYDEFNQNLIQKFDKTKTGTSYPYYRQSILKYPVNYNSVLNEPFMQDLVNINKINNPIINEIYEGEFDLIDENQTYPAQLLSKSKIIFSKDSKTSNKVLPIQKQIAKDGYNFYDTAIFDRYDNKGNLLQSTNDGIPTTYIYGYNQNYPIATIVGATYDQVMTAFGKDPNDNQAYLQLDIVNKSILDIDQNTENNLIKELDTFRANSDLANYQITTQTYDPLIGVTSSTPPNGIREVYKYDSNNRLIEVKDINGRIIKENKYKYK